MLFTTYYDIDVSPGGIPLTIDASQYDADARTILFNLVSRNGVLVLPAGVHAEVRGTKPDGNGFSYNASISGNQVEVAVTEQMCAVAGRVICELVIYIGTPATEAEEASADFEQLCTATFYLMVKRAALDKDTLKSGSEIRQLIEVIDRTDELLAAAATMDDAKATIVAKTKEATDAAADSKDSADSAAETLRQVNEKAAATEQSVNQTLQTVENKTQQLLRITYDSDYLAKEALQKAEDAGNEAAATSSKLDKVNEDMDLVRVMADAKVDGAFEENGYLYLTANNEIVVGPLGPFSSNGSGGGGGGGSSGNNAQLKVTNTSGWLSNTVAAGDACPISLNWTSTEEDIPTGNGTLKVTVGGVLKATLDITQGDVTVNIAPYLSTGSNSIRVNVADVYGNNRTVNFSVSVVVLSITSSFDSSVPYTSIISFPYVPTGNVSKTVHFILDGTEIGTAVTSISGRQQTFLIPQQSHGAHSFRVYFDSEINGALVRSNELYFEILCLEAGEDDPIITCNIRETEVAQYTTVHLIYNVYDPTSMMADVKIKLNGEIVSEQTVGRTEQDYSYRADEVGTLNFEIVSGEKSRPVTITVIESPIKVEAETENLALYLSSRGRSNAEARRTEWTYENIAASLTGFNYVSDGWVNDREGITVLRVSGDARVTIPYQIFAEDFRTKGKTIELEFTTRNVMNYDAVILSCLSGKSGIFLTPQMVKLSSEQSSLSMQFKEDEHVRVSFVVEKRTENRLIFCYINGIMSGAIQYPVNDDFSQGSPVGISIGSNDCTIDLYCIRVYDNDLSRQQILDNWIADTQDVNQMLNRYQRNRIYDEYGNIVVDKLPTDLPYMILQCVELPQYKGDKKTVSGSYVDPLNPTKCFTFTDAQFDVQGTSSQYYERKNYKGKFKNGFVLPSGVTVKSFQMRDDSIPVSTFCFKADVASSEGANNVELVRLYNDASTYKTPAQLENPDVRQGIDGFPILIFWNNGTDTVFIGKYNFNNDKSTDEVFGFEDGDESWEVKNNTGNRVLWKSADYTGSGWLNDFEARYPDTDPAYEDSSQLREFAEWIVHTDTERATGNALAEPVTYTVTTTEIVEKTDEETGAISYEEVKVTQDVTFNIDTVDYRLAKFRAELPQYVELQSALFYYLFTETFLMVDSRAKNMFPSFIGSRIGGNG